MQPLTGPYTYGTNRRSENFLLLSDLLFALGRCTRSRYKRVEIRVVLGCVFMIICDRNALNTVINNFEVCFHQEIPL